MTILGSGNVNELEGWYTVLQALLRFLMIHLNRDLSIDGQLNQLNANF